MARREMCSSHCLESELLPDTMHLFPSQKKQVRSRDKQRRRGVIRAVCRVPSLPKRNFNISAMVLNSAFILAVARRGLGSSAILSRNISGAQPGQALLWWCLLC